MTALSIMGLTYQAMRGRLVKALGAGGDEKVGKAEKTVQVLQTMRTGLHKADEMKSEGGSVSGEISEGIKSEVTQSVVVAGIKKLVTMLIPGGGFINAIIGAFQTVQTIVQQAAQIGSMIMNGLASISAIAAGNIGGAVNKIESTLVSGLSVALSWLTKVLGLGNLGSKIRGIITKVKGKLDKVLDKIVAKVKGIIEKLMGKGKSTEKDGKASKNENGKPIELTLQFAGHTLFVKQASTPILDMASTRGSLSNKAGRHASRIKSLQKQYPVDSDENRELERHFGEVVSIGKSAKSFQTLLKNPVDANSQTTLAIQQSSRSLVSEIGSFLKRNQLQDVGDDLEAWITKYKAEKDKLHGEFEPQNLTVSTDGKTIKISYHTKTGKSFQTTIGRSGHVAQSKGFNLAITSLGRGTTHDPANKVKNYDQNSAHAVANLFGGSGYRSSLNLITTSKHFNQVVMKGAEDRILNWVKSNRIAVFDLTVDVDWGQVSDEAVVSKIIDQINNLNQLAGDRLTKAKNSIARRIKDFKPILKAVEDVVYKASGQDIDSKSKKLPPIHTGADMWLNTP